MNPNLNKSRVENAPYDTDLLLVNALSYMLINFLPQGSDYQQYMHDFWDFIHQTSADQIKAKFVEFNGNYRALTNFYVWSFLTPNITIEVPTDSVEVDIAPEVVEFWEGIMAENQQVDADEA